MQHCVSTLVLSVHRTLVQKPCDLFRCKPSHGAVIKFNKLGHPDLTGSSKGVFSFRFYVAVKNEEKVEIPINKNSAICLRAATYFPAKVNKQAAAFLDKHEIIKSIHVGV